MNNNKESNSNVVLKPAFKIRLGLLGILLL